MSELFEKLKEYADSDYLPMHMPGHKRRMGEIGNPFFIDITEIGGFDNLHHAQGLLLEAQKRAASLYRSEETHYLINGSTAGILSAVSGCTSFGGKILLARNSHKSAYHAVLLRGLRIHCIYPQSTGKMGINGVILPEDVDKALQSDPDIQAVLVTSPTYDGVVSDIKAIARIVHRYGIPLIVDEAHGAHFPFSGHFPEDSVSCGADVVIHSLHKTLPTLTQTALIHLNGSLIDKENIRKFLTVYQSSSPSYVLMASLDNCVEWIDRHRDAFETLWGRIQKLRDGLRGMKKLRLLEIAGMDETKILVSVQDAGIDGHELDRILREEYHIEMEMACSTYVCAITSVGDTEESLKRLLTAFLDLDERLCCGSEQSVKCTEALNMPRQSTDEVLPTEAVCTILKASEGEKESCPIRDACGKISGDFVVLYPPGIPILAPGEKISREIEDRLLEYEKEGFEVHGVRDGRIQVLKRIGEWEKYFV